MKNTRIPGLGLPDRPLGRVFAAGLLTALIALVARSNFILQPAWSVDSYNNWLGWPGLDLFVQQGRVGQYLMIAALESFGFDRNSSASVLQGLGVAIFALIAPFMLAAFSRQERLPILPLVIAASLFVLHPFQAEILTFPEASFFPAVACALGVASITLVAHNQRLWWLGSLLLLAALSIYQLVLNYACIMVLFGLVLAWVEASTKTGSFREKDAVRPFASSALTISAALFLYLLGNKVITFTLKADQEGRAQLIGIADLEIRVDQVVSLAQELLRMPLLIDLPIPSILLWATVVFGWAFFLLKVVRNRTVSMVVPLSVLPMIALASLGVVLVGSTWWPVPRVLGGVTLVMACGMHLALTLPTPKWLRRGVIVTSLLVITTSIAVSHRIHADQLQVNSHDRYLAQLIYQRLIETQGFSEELPLVITNTRMLWTHPVAVRTVKGDLNISAFSVPWSTAGLFALSTGRRLDFKNPDEQDEEMCTALAPWPSPEAVVVLPDKALICL